MSDLVPKQDNAIATADPSGFWGEMESSDFAIPSVTIGQGTSVKGVVGEFNFNNGSHTKTIVGVSLLVPSKTRTLFAGKGKPTRCGSDNFHTPSPRYQNPISQSCLTCYAAAWGRDDDDKRQLHGLLGVKKDVNQPLCQQTYSMMFLDSDGNPFFMDFRSSALKIVQEKLLSRLRMGFSRTHPTAVQFDMAIFRNDGKEGAFYEPVFDNFRISDFGRSAIASGLYSQYSKRAQSLRSDQIAKMDEATAKASEFQPNEAPMDAAGFDPSEDVPF